MSDCKYSSYCLSDLHSSQTAESSTVTWHIGSASMTNQLPFDELEAWRMLKRFTCVSIVAFLHLKKKKPTTQKSFGSDDAKNSHHLCNLSNTKDAFPSSSFQTSHSVLIGLHTGHLTACSLPLCCPPDVDECAGEGPGPCGLHADCTNKPGSYSCACVWGYLMGPDGCQGLCLSQPECVM